MVAGPKKLDEIQGKLPQGMKTKFENRSDSISLLNIKENFASQKTISFRC
jgi:hypothetical protein